MRVYEPLEGFKLKHLVTMVILGVKLAREAGASKPVSPRLLVVEADGSSISEEFSEALVRAFHAKLKAPSDVKDYVVARLEGLSEDTVKLSFHWKGALVGPQLKLRKPRNVKAWISQFH